MRRLVLAAAIFTLCICPVSAGAQDDIAVRTARVDDVTFIRQIKNLQARWGHLAVSAHASFNGLLGIDLDDPA